MLGRWSGWPLTFIEWPFSSCCDQMSTVGQGRLMEERLRRLGVLYFPVSEMPLNGFAASNRFNAGCSTSDETTHKLFVRAMPS